MLKKVRVIIASLFFVLITLLFLDTTGALHLWFGWMAKIQLLPAVLALNFAVVAVLALVTLLFGRIYCSVICPLGIMQDIISWFSARRKGKRARFTYKKANNWLRYGMLVLFVVLMVAGVSSIAALIAPYSAYGRIASNLLSPVWGWMVNLAAAIDGRIGAYNIYPTDVYIKSLPLFIVALVTFIVIFIIAWKGGRTWCNTICPVGTVLGAISRFSIFRVEIDESKCTGCTICSKKCKSSCINPAEHKIDYSRCVACFDCIDNCSQGAIRYKLRSSKKKSAEEEAKADAGRRAFLIGSVMAGTAAAFEAKAQKLDGGLAEVLDKKVPERGERIVPAGAESIKHFHQHCTACQLCVQNCPNKVLRPSADFDHFMQPEMQFDKGYCRPECTNCSQVCPAGAIKPITPEEKTVVHIGHAVVNHDLCVSVTDEVGCGTCARNCPVGAIKMVPRNPEDKKSPRVPAVDEAMCIGCGKCEYLCPARPYSAIHVDGNLVHIKD